MAEDYPVACQAYVVLDGGPRDGWAYDAPSIETQARSRINQGLPFEYEPTGRVFTHKYFEKKNAVEIQAEMWKWKG